MYGVTVSYMLLLFISIWNGWMIMQDIGRGENFENEIASVRFRSLMDLVLTPETQGLAFHH
jgi:hypothetical protein